MSAVSLVRRIALPGFALPSGGSECQAPASLDGLTSGQ